MTTRDRTRGGARAVVSRDALGPAGDVRAGRRAGPERLSRSEPGAPCGSRAWAIVLKDLAHDVREGLGKVRAGRTRRGDRARPGLARHGVDVGGRGAGRLQLRVTLSMWEAYRLPEVERDELTFGPVPHLAPLIDIVEDHERYAVALVDKERARLFTVFMAEIEATESFEDEVPGKHDQGGLSQMKYQRDHEKHVLWHLKRVVEELSGLLRAAVVRPPGRRRPRGGDGRADGACCPHELASRLVDDDPDGDADAGAARIRDATLEIERRVRTRERRRPGHRTHRGGRRPRPRFVRNGRDPGGAHDCGAVHTLILADGLSVGGSECPNCGWMQEGPIEAVPDVRADDATRWRHRRPRGPPDTRDGRRGRDRPRGGRSSG